jgi:MFS superfamily sulfate permease-like transporter
VLTVVFDLVVAIEVGMVLTGVIYLIRKISSKRKKA